jgi:hypothetical protein
MSCNYMPIVRQVAIGFGIAFLAACSSQQSAPSGEAPAPAPAPAPAATASPATPIQELPVSLNAVMVGMVNNVTKELFAVGNAIREGGSGKPPKTDADWREVEYHAYQLIVAGRIIQVPGTGPRDREWTANPAWKPFADALTDLGNQMLQKAQAKTTDGFVELNDRLIDNCEGCHRVFKPDIPTMRILAAPGE